MDTFISPETGEMDRYALYTLTASSFHSSHIFLDPYVFWAIRPVFCALALRGSPFAIDMFYFLRYFPHCDFSLSFVRVCCMSSL